MEKPRVLSGEALVAKGITKIDASLPDVGLKDVMPNGSWLEQKQIQAALEARKYLIEVERIEKCGTLSHAEWRDDLKLAEVTQKAGGHWQYLGHNVGKILYLRPEEALFLMEVNCLLLKHNEVTVSLQNAYSLLLSSPTAMIEYKVYASLSRLGYRVFRHTGPKVNDEKKTYNQRVNKFESKAKHSDCPIADTNKSANVDSPVSTVNKTHKVDSSTVSTVESEAGCSVVSTLNNSENVGSPIVATVNESKNDSSVLNILVAEPGTPINNTVSDSRDDSSIVETVPGSDIVDTPKHDTVEKSENHDSPMTDKVNEQEVHEDSEVNGNIVEKCEIKASDEMTEKLDAENNVAKENESPNIMEVDETTESKAADINVETEPTQEVPSTMTEIKKNTENKNTREIMEICTENQETVQVVEINDDAGGPVSATNNSEAGRIDTGIQSIEDSAIFLEKLPHNNYPSNTKICTSTENMTEKVYFTNHCDPSSYLSKIEKLTKRQLKPSDSKAMDKYFENIPDLSKELVATINVPEQQYIPKNIFVNKRTYTLNLQNIRMRTVRSVSSESPAYTSSDEVSGTNIRRIRSSLELLSTLRYPQNQNFHQHVRFQNFPRYHQFRPYGFWRPQNNVNIYQLMFFQARFQYHQRPHMFLRPPCFSIPPNNNLNTSNNPRKRMRNGKFVHFQGIRNLALRLKQSLISGNADMSNLGTLHSLLHSYNLRYKTRLRLTEHFDVINEEKIVETIDLDEDEESKSKKTKVDKDDDDKFDENLSRLRQLALTLRELEIKDKAAASLRRAFSKAIKTFNKSYNADIYLDDVNYEVIDRRFITLDSSSESDCIVEEQPQVRTKKLRNPFNILKRRKEKQQSINNPGTSKDDNSLDPSQNGAGPSTDEDSNQYSDFTLKTFSENWLPNEKDFGRAEVVPKSSLKSRLEFSNKEQFIYEYKNDQFQNWLEAKISFLRYLEETNIAFKREQARMLADVELCNTGLKPLLDFEDSSDMPSVLEKLRIIENNKEVDIETSLRIDFEVYNRNVQNFRKRNPPKPHFRIICLDESSGVPSAAHVMSLHSKYDDNVPIVFAIVSIGSISYLQINPIDLPIYVPSNDVV